MYIIPRMSNKPVGVLGLALSNGDSFPDSVTGDFIVATSASNHTLRLGCEGTPTSLQVTSSNVILSNLSISGDIVPVQNHVQNIGTSNARFRTAYVDTLFLSSNTLYLGTTAVLGTSASTINISADSNQSINMATTGTGSTLVTSQNNVNISTSGMNGQVNVQATGAGGTVAFGANTQINFTAPTCSFTGAASVSGSLSASNMTVYGDLTVGGTTTTVNATNIQVHDNIITLNYGENGNGVSAIGGQAGLRVARGQLPDYEMVFDETSQALQVGQMGQLQPVATQPWAASNLLAACNASFSNINFTGSFKQNGANYIGSQFSNSGANVFLLGSNLGVGKSNPTVALDVAGSATIGSNLTVASGLASFSNINFTGNLTQNGTAFTSGGVGGDSLVGSYAATTLFFYENQPATVGVTDSNAMYLMATYASNTAAAALPLSGASNLSVSGTITASNINFTGSFKQNGAPYVGSQFSNSGTSVFLMGSNLGIGKSNPTVALDVVGSINAGTAFTQGGSNLSTIFATAAAVNWASNAASNSLVQNYAATTLFFTKNQPVQPGSITSNVLYPQATYASNTAAAALPGTGGTLTGGLTIASGGLTASNGLATFSNVNFTGALTQNGAPFVSGGGGGGSAGVFSVDSNNGTTISVASNWSAVSAQSRYFPARALAVDGTGADIANGIAVDSSANMYLAGTSPVAATIYNSNAASSGIATQKGGFLAQYTSAGTAAWTAGVSGASGTQTGTSTAVDGSANVFLAGAYDTAAPTVYNAGAAASGMPALPAPAGGTSAYLVKYDNMGKAQWTTVVDGTGADGANAVAADATGAVVVAGVTSGSAPATVYDASTVMTTVAYPLSAYAAVTTVAGSGTQTFLDGTATNAGFNQPNGVAVDASGNVYVADTFNNRIRKITPAGVVTTFAGSGTASYGNGTGTLSGFANPYDLAVDASGTVYVADTGTCTIRKITSSGVVTTLAGKVNASSYLDGTGTAACFSGPVGVAVDANGTVYVADTSNGRIRMITPAGVVTTLAGSGTQTFLDGTGTAAGFLSPQGIAVDAGGFVYVGDYGNQRVRKISPAGVVTTLVGTGSMSDVDGTGTGASIRYPNGIAVDASGTVYVAIQSNRIRKITPAGVLTTLAGSATPTYLDGTGTIAGFNVTNNGTNGVAVDAFGNVYVADVGNNRIRRIETAGVGVTILAGGTSGTPTFADGVGAYAGFNLLQGVAVDTAGNVYVADYGNNRIRKVTAAGVVTTFAGSGTLTYLDGTGTNAGFKSPAGVAVDSSGNVYVADTNNNRIRKITAVGVVTTLAGSGTSSYGDGTGTNTGFNVPSGLVVDASGNVYVADTSNHRIRKITIAGVVTTLAGSGTGTWLDGTGTNAGFNGPSGVAVDTSGNVYVADQNNNRIRKITAAGIVSTLAGSGTPTLLDGIGFSAGFSSPNGVAVDAIGNVYVADYINGMVRKIDRNQVVTTVASINPGNPVAVTVDLAGNLYVADSSYQNIRKLSAPVVVSTFAGSGTATYLDGQGVAAGFKYSNGVAVDSAGNMYVGDSSNHRIRKITAAGLVSTFAGSGTATFLDGTGTNAGFNLPYGVAVDSSGNVYVADANNQRIRKITASGVVTTMAGSGTSTYLDGSGTNAGFNTPRGVAVDTSGNVYVGDYGGNRIRKITAAGVVTTLAGSGTNTYLDGSGTNAGFYQPNGVAVDSSGNVYVGDVNNYRIRKITAAGVVTTLAGSGAVSSGDGTGTNAGFYLPSGVAVDASGNVYVGDYNNNRIRKITSAGVVTTLAGSGTGTWLDGTGTNAGFYQPTGVAVDSVGNVYVADANNSRIRKLTFPATQSTASAITASSTVTLPTGAAANPAAFAVKYSSAGVSQWSAVMDGASADSAAAVATDSTNNVYMVGSYGTSQPTLYTAASNYAVRTSLGSNAAYAVKLSSAGAMQWIVSADGVGNDQGLGSVVDTSGNLYLAGTYAGASATVYNANNAASALALRSPTNGAAAFVVKYNSSGAAQWIGSVDGVASNALCSLALDSTNNVYVAGSYLGASSPVFYGSNGAAYSSVTLPAPTGNAGSNTASFVVKYSSAGAPAGAWATMGTSNSTANCLYVDSTGSNVTMAGMLTNTAKLYDGNAASNATVAFPAGMTTQAAYAATHALALSPVTLVSNLGASNAGLQKLVTNTGASAVTLNVTSSNNASVLNSYALQPGSNAMFAWLGAQWYKLY